MKCAAPDCAKHANHPTFGLCHMHYKRQYRTGSLNAARGNRGSGTVNAHGYVVVGGDANKRGVHRIVAERALGKPLPAGAEVHHVNENKADNRPENLVICPSRAYHKLLHQRMAAMDACGNAGFRKCPLCGTYDDPSRMTHNKSSRYYYHPACRTADNQSRKESAK